VKSTVTPSVEKPALPTKPSATAQEHKPALTDFSESKTQPTVGVTAVAKAAATAAGTSAAGAAPLNASKFDSVFKGTASTVADSETKTDDKNKLSGRGDAKQPVLRIEDPLANETDVLDPLKDHGVPSFGAMGKLPFAGFDEEKPKRSKAPLIAALALIVVGGGAYAAWATQPDVRAFMGWEYGNIRTKIDAMRGKAPVTAAVKPQPAPVPAAPVQPAPAQNPETIDIALAAGGTADAPAGPAAAAQSTSDPSVSAATSSAPTPSTAPAKTATIQSAKQDTTPGHTGSSASLVPASLPPTTTAKPPASDLFEVAEDFADDQVVHRVHPTYPKQALAKRLHGSVVLQAIVSKQGKVDSLQLVSGDPILAQAAATAVKQWRYKPYWHNNEPSDFQTRVTVEFKLP
jgi:protein TonB